MHACSICRRSCSCGGDTSEVIALREPAGCICCISQCEHRVDLDIFCAACEAESFTPEPDAASTPSMNGGW